MAYTLVSGTSENLEVAWVDEAGNAAVVDGPVVWASSDGTICPVVVDPADSSKSVMGKGALAGTAQITATGDADIGAGVTTLTAILDVTVIAGQAFAGTITPVGSPF